LLSAVESSFNCASNWRAAAIIATIVSTALTFELFERAVGEARVRVGGRSPSAARNRPSVPRWSGPRASPS
jgi:hypothetical protein